MWQSHRIQHTEKAGTSGLADRVSQLVPHVRWNRTLCSATAIVAGCLLVQSVWADEGEAKAVFDDFDTPAGWKYPVYQYGLRQTGSAQIRDGSLLIRRNPGGKYHMLSAEKIYRLDFKSDAWLHFRFRFHEMLLGADMYATVTLDGKTLVQMGINGEQHWTMFKECLAKEHDDEMFFGSPCIRGESNGKNTDIRIGLAPELLGKIRYTDWHVFSLQYADEGENCRLRLFVDGREVVYRDLDAAAPNGVFDTTIVEETVRARPGNRLTVSLGALGDGDLYGDQRVHDGAGVRWLHAFADDSPAIPSPHEPSKAVKKTALLEWDYVMLTGKDGLTLQREQVERLVHQGRFPQVMAERLWKGK